MLVHDPIFFARRLKDPVEGTTFRVPKVNSPLGVNPHEPPPVRREAVGRKGRPAHVFQSELPFLYSLPAGTETKNAYRKKHCHHKPPHAYHPLV